jgi:hypothetical protein
VYTWTISDTNVTTSIIVVVSGSMRNPTEILEVARPEPRVDVAVEHVARPHVGPDEVRGHQRHGDAEDAEPVRRRAAELRPNSRRRRRPSSGAIGTSR